MTSQRVRRSSRDQVTPAGLEAGLKIRPLRLRLNDLLDNSPHSAVVEGKRCEELAEGGVICICEEIRGLATRQMRHYTKLAFMPF